MCVRILYLTQWFDPEPAFKGADFAAALAARGHDVEVATAFPNYPGGKLYPGYRIRPYANERIRGLKVHRLWVYPSHDASSFGRIANYLSFFVSALVFGLLRAHRYDVIYVYHPPITPGVAAALFGMVRRKPMVIEIQDLWPDSVMASGMAGGRTDRILTSLCRFVYRRASHVIPQSDGMRARLIERGVPEQKLTRIFNWSTYQAPSAAAPALPDKTHVLGPAGRFNIIYGGNLGQAQALSSVIHAVAAARRIEPAVHLHLFGHGIESGPLVELASSVAPDGVTLHGTVDRVAMDRIFDLANALVMHLKDDPLYEITLPSKMQHYLSCGKPVIAGIRGEAAKLLLQSGAALVTQPEDVQTMADAMVQLARMSPIELQAMGQRGKRFYESHMAFDFAVDETLGILSRAVLVE
ncbi:hypothetical protein B5J99_05765 [Blastomonas fulva]|uniref:Glycosyltransferase subfamily 4-like N-terminal domain-containing protein n=1 Tax=Blastomonas fulva TaxID=1550728 RepID=A0ABM6M5H1_9SPHN|nr:hypothetical protein B5J99_05765 [Blastomonas fulva]